MTLHASYSQLSCTTAQKLLLLINSRIQNNTVDDEFYILLYFKPRTHIITKKDPKSFLVLFISSHHFFCFNANTENI